MSLHLGNEKFRMAMLDLVAPGDIHQRVSAALNQHLLHIDDNEDLPEPAKKPFRQLKHSLQIDDNARHNVSAIIDGLSEVEVEKIAQRIVALFEAVISGAGR